MEDRTLLTGPERLAKLGTIWAPAVHVYLCPGATLCGAASGDNTTKFGYAATCPECLAEAKMWEGRHIIAEASDVVRNFEAQL